MSNLQQFQQDLFDYKAPDFIDGASLYLELTNEKKANALLNFVSENPYLVTGGAGAVAGGLYGGLRTPNTYKNPERNESRLGNVARGALVGGAASAATFGPIADMVANTMRYSNAAKHHAKGIEDVNIRLNNMRDKIKNVQHMSNEVSIPTGDKSTLLVRPDQVKPTVNANRQLSGEMAKAVKPKVHKPDFSAYLNKKANALQVIKKTPSVGSKVKDFGKHVGTLGAMGAGIGAIRSTAKHEGESTGQRLKRMGGEIVDGGINGAMTGAGLYAINKFKKTAAIDLDALGNSAVNVGQDFVNNFAKPQLSKFRNWAGPKAADAGHAVAKHVVTNPRAAGAILGSTVGAGAESQLTSSPTGGVGGALLGGLAGYASGPKLLSMATSVPPIAGETVKRTLEQAATKVANMGMLTKGLQAAGGALAKSPRIAGAVGGGLLGGTANTLAGGDFSTGAAMGAAGGAIGGKRLLGAVSNKATPLLGRNVQQGAVNQLKATRTAATAAKNPAAMATTNPAASSRLSPAAATSPISSGAPPVAQKPGTAPVAQANPYFGQVKDAPMMSTNNTYSAVSSMPTTSPYMGSAGIHHVPQPTASHSFNAPTGISPEAANVRSTNAAMNVYDSAVRNPSPRVPINRGAAPQAEVRPGQQYKFQGIPSDIAESLGKMRI